ncbi:hypothetical protein [Halovivax asiaticus]|nr:hypothetical protein [Halovivax asiaticus]
MAGAGAVGTVGLVSGVPPFSPVGRAEGVICGGICSAVAAAGTAAAAGAVAGWALREYEVIGSDDPPEGLTPDALKNQVYQSAETRFSTLNSTFTDNINIAETGLSHQLYADGKVAGIESLNNQDTQETVTATAREAANAHATTVLTNYFKSWNEAVNEYYSFRAAVSDHPDLATGDVFDFELVSEHDPLQDKEIKSKATKTVDLPDGSTFDLQCYQIYCVGNYDNYQSNFTLQVSPVGVERVDGSLDGLDTIEDLRLTVTGLDATISYLSSEGATTVYNRLNNVITEVSDGLTTWVDGVYGQVQAGELDTAELLTPRELAEMSTGEGEFNQAIQDLAALNIPVDFEREAEIYLQESDSTLYGQLAPTSVPDGGVSKGDEIDPETSTADWYFTYDVSQGHGTWSDYESAVNGGVVTFTAEPFEGSRYVIETVAGESAEVVADDFTPDDPDNPTAWTVDISGQVQNAITEIEGVAVYSQTDETEYWTVQLDETFTVKKITDSDGNEVEELDFSQNEPQTDDNYITEEEWAAMQERQEELIKKYEEAKNDGGGGWSWPWEGGGSGGMIAGAVALIGIAWGVGQVTGN